MLRSMLGVLIVGLAFTCVAQAEPELSIQSGYVSNTEETAYISVDLHDDEETPSGLTSLTFDVVWSPDELVWKWFSDGWVVGDYSVVAEEVHPGRYRFSVSSLDADVPLPDGSLVEMLFGFSGSATNGGAVLLENVTGSKPNPDAEDPPTISVSVLARSGEVRAQPVLAAGWEIYVEGPGGLYIPSHASIPITFTDETASGLTNLSFDVQWDRELSLDQWIPDTTLSDSFVIAGETLSENSLRFTVYPREGQTDCLPNGEILVLIFDVNEESTFGSRVGFSSVSGAKPGTTSDEPAMIPVGILGEGGGVDIAYMCKGCFDEGSPPEEGQIEGVVPQEGGAVDEGEVTGQDGEPVTADGAIPEAAAGTSQNVTFGCSG